MRDRTRSRPPACGQCLARNVGCQTKHPRVASASVNTAIRTQRLVLEPYVPEDEEGFVALFGDVRVSRWMGSGALPEPEVRALFRRIFTHVYARDLFDVWGVRQDGHLIGHAEIKSTDVVEGGGHEIIYALAPTAWGSGLGTEIADAILRVRHASAP